jgi:VIT1/CCC1 family predicted Fe2+/Mn2+ transporter
MSKHDEHHHNEENALYLRNFIFGVEDSLVSTVGMLSGVAIANTPKATILLAGLVLIFVEAFSMGVGSYLSEESSEGFMKGEGASERKSILGAIIMWLSYFCAGFIPLGPYLFLEPSQAFWISITLAVGTLFVLGGLAARLAHISIVKHALKMAIIGGIAIGLGVTVGSIVNGLAIV